MYLLLLGLIPFILGTLMNKWILQDLDRVLPYKLIGILFLVFWAMIGFMSSKIGKTWIRSMMIVHSPALLVLFSIMYQNIILAHYWTNVIGEITQLFYMPLYNIASSVTGVFLSFTAWPVTVWLSSIIACILMLAAYYIGAYARHARG